MKNAHSGLMILLAAGTCTGAAVAQSGLVNVSGATLLENYVRSFASTNDYIDVDGNGVAGYLGTGLQQLAPSGPSILTQPLHIQYRAVGSVNGFIELTRFGSGRCATGDDVNTAGILGNRPAANVNGVASNAYHNRILYINNGNSGGIPGTYNFANPGGSPVTSNAVYQVLYASPGTSSGGQMCIDVSPIDVSSSLATKKSGGSPAWNRKPLEAGYGTNPILSATRPFGATGFGNLSNELADLNGRNLFDPQNPGAADSNTIFDNSLAFAPIAPVVNYGTGVQRFTMTELQHLFLTGRAASGENFIVSTRDVGSGTRNAFNNCIGIDPSFGRGDNIGGISTSGNQHLLGNEFTPTNKGSNGGMEQVLRNTRLGIGYVGTERGVSGTGTGSWLSTGALEIADVRNDLYGGTDYVRPTTMNIVKNGANGWLIGGQAVLATVGDPRSNAANVGGQGWAGAFDPFNDLNCDGVRQVDEPFTDLNGNGQYDSVNAEAGLAPRLTPPMANPFAAAYINNIERSIASTISVPNDVANLGMPGEFAANQFLLIAALDRVHLDSNYVQMVSNPALNNCVQTYTISNNIHNNAAFTAFNDTVAGRVPARKTGVVYTDGVAGGANYIRQGSVSSPNQAVSYNGVLALRNKIAADFDGDGVRSTDDAIEMLKAYRQRFAGGSPRWNAPDGIYGAGAGEQAIIEVLGDFDGDGNFNAADVRYFADGLVVVNGSLNRSAGFGAVDQAWQTLTGGNNFFGTILATGGTYLSGDSRADLAGSSVGARPGYSPTGANGVIDAADIDYIYRQFKNDVIIDGSASWNDLNEATFFDLSADLNGDLEVNQGDICEMLAILGTSAGDVNLDGVRDAADLNIAMAYRNGTDVAGGWANGDSDGDGFVTEADLAIIVSGDCNCFCPADYNRDGGVDGGDVESFFSDWSGSVGCADVNIDGGIDGGDVETFFSLWSAGGC